MLGGICCILRVLWSSEKIIVNLINDVVIIEINGSRVSKDKMMMRLILFGNWIMKL